MNCPKCNGAMWDNRVDKKTAKSPDWKCKDKNCGEAVWEKKSNGNAAPAQQASQPFAQPTPPEFGNLTGVPMAASQNAGAISKMDQLMALHAVCFDHAMSLAAKAGAKGVVINCEAISSLTAQLFIASTQGGR